MSVENPQLCLVVESSGLHKKTSYNCLWADEATINVRGTFLLLLTVTVRPERCTVRASSEIRENFSSLGTMGCQKVPLALTFQLQDIKT
jgi:hypothetical protein